MVKQFQFAEDSLFTIPQWLLLTISSKSSLKNFLLNKINYRWILLSPLLHCHNTLMHLRFLFKDVITI